MEMPTLGAAPKKSPIAGVAIAAVIAGGIAGGAYWWTHRVTAPLPQPEAVAAAPAEAAPAAAPANGTTAPAAVPGAPAVAAPTAADPAAAATAAGLKSFATTITGPLESAIIAKAGKEAGTPLTQVVTRTLVWWLRVPQDLVKGDTLAVIYEERNNQEPLVHAVRLTSQKLGKTVEAYRYKATGDTFARFVQPDGSELEERLVGGPLDSYEQITSLLKDGRKHKGVDFKTPVGTPVHATFDGVVVRKNWNFRGNGNCLELEEVGGQHRNALFLHLSEVSKLALGDRVHMGDVVAKSGNTGHSFAPHLHYQLMKGETVVDPFEVHKVTRTSVPAADRPRLDAEIARLRGLLPAEQLAGG